MFNIHHCSSWAHHIWKCVVISFIALFKSTSLFNSYVRTCLSALHTILFSYVITQPEPNRTYYYFPFPYRVIIIVLFFCVIMILCFYVFILCYSSRTIALVATVICWLYPTLNKFHLILVNIEDTYTHCWYFGERLPCDNDAVLPLVIETGLRVSKEKWVSVTLIRFALFNPSPLDKWPPFHRR